MTTPSRVAADRLDDRPPGRTGDSLVSDRTVYWGPFRDDELDPSVRMRWRCCADRRPNVDLSRILMTPMGGGGSRGGSRATGDLHVDPEARQRPQDRSRRQTAIMPHVGCGADTVIITARADPRRAGGRQLRRRGRGRSALARQRQRWEVLCGLRLRHRGRPGAIAGARAHPDRSPGRCARP